MRGLRLVLGIVSGALGEHHGTPPAGVPARHGQRPAHAVIEQTRAADPHDRDRIGLVAA